MPPAVLRLASDIQAVQDVGTASKGRATITGVQRSALRCPEIGATPTSITAGSSSPRT